ncbi:MAG: hypothetical protein EPN91_03465 [Salinibacterium sp.]|nr:MAG: hypothetical protein EPN91_03465 [Salinibacterium sp.]
MTGAREPSPAIDLLATPIGTRVVVRYLIDDGRATDALGPLRSVNESHAVIDTKRGLESVPLDRVIAAKEVPPAPKPRPR